MNKLQFQLESWRMTKDYREYRRAKLERKERAKAKKLQREHAKAFGYYIKDEEKFDDWLLKELGL
tara:strand:+ start:367 stop:561 length:195 start_codon:yes stop_codon:yes gene_type:complete